MNGNGVFGEAEFIRRHHYQRADESRCSSVLINHIKAPIQLVWSLVRRFDQPQKYKPFISRCVAPENPEIGSLREVDIMSGLPATTSTERLELLDDNEHVLRMRIIGGDHRLTLLTAFQDLEPLSKTQLFGLGDDDFGLRLTDAYNYSSIISVHPELIDGKSGTMVIESFVVDIPEGNTKEETCSFVEALINCNLKSLADVSERLALQGWAEPDILQI